jgi:hypothetical protein
MIICLSIPTPFRLSPEANERKDHAFSNWCMTCYLSFRPRPRPSSLVLEFPPKKDRGRGRRTRTIGKAPSPLRSAGALHSIFTSQLSMIFGF